MNRQMHPEQAEYLCYQQRAQKEREAYRMEQFFDTLKNRAKYSPDAGSVRLKDNILLFVYDNFKLGGFDNAFLRTCKYLGKAKTVVPHFIIKTSTKKTIVAFQTTPKDEKGGIICGEVYAVTPNILFELDQLKDNGEKFIRIEKHTVLTEQSYTVKDNKIKNPILSCMIYVGNKKFWPFEEMTPVGCYLTKRNKRIYEHHAGMVKTKSILEIGDDDLFTGSHHSQYYSMMH